MRQGDNEGRRGRDHTPLDRKTEVQSNKSDRKQDRDQNRGNVTQVCL